MRVPKASIAHAARRHRTIGQTGWVRLILIATMVLCPVLSTLQAAQEDGRDRRSDRPSRRRGLVKRLTQGKDAPREDVMQRMLSLMEDADRRLRIDLTAGTETQAIQEEIAEALDEAIQTAAAQRRPKRSRNQRFRSDKRKSQKSADASSSSKQKARGQSGDEAKDSDEQREGVDPSRVAEGGELEETRRGWGHLPTRERDEIIQGRDEQYLQRYREWVERYYRALQEQP